MIELRSEDGGWESEHGRATVDCCLSSIRVVYQKGTMDESNEADLVKLSESSRS